MEIKDLIGTCGVIDIEPDKLAELRKAIPEDEIQVKPNGVVFAPWHVYESRLSSAFGLQWAIIPDPQNGPQVYDDNTTVRGAFWLFIKGNAASWAVGEQSKTHGNMGIGEMIEGCKSNAVMRLCKGIGIGLNLWDREFITNFMKNNVVKVEVKNNFGKTKQVHMLKRQAIKEGLYRENLKDREDNPVDRVNQVMGKDFKFLSAMSAEKKRVGNEAYYAVLKEAGYKKSSDITDSKDKVSVYKRLQHLTEEKKGE